MKPLKLAIHSIKKIIRTIYCKENIYEKLKIYFFKTNWGFRVQLK